MRFGYCLLFSVGVHVTGLVGVSSLGKLPSLSITQGTRQVKLALTELPRQKVTEALSEQPKPVIGVSPLAPPKVRPRKLNSKPSSYTSKIPLSPRVATQADYLQNPPPRYPIQARRRKQEGSVVLKVALNSIGGVETIEMKSSSGFSLLDREALRAVKDWKFSPARAGHHPVNSLVLVPIKFELTG